MPNSFSQTTQLTCPQTNKPFDFEVWLIIDRDERPDLIEKVKDGTLHAVTSPYTGDQLGELDAPLLIFQPNHTPPLFYSPARQTTQEQDQQQAMGLVGQLRQSLGDKWQNDWVQNGIAGIPRPLVPEALVDFGQAIQKLHQAMRNQQQTGDNSDDDELRRILYELSQPPRDARDMPRRVELHRRALALLPKEDNEQLWVMLKGELGIALLQNPLGDRAQNIEDAIAAYEQVLEVYTRETYPERWAATQNNLANAYRNRILGSSQENIELAIYHYQQALEIYTREAYPERWAVTQNNLGNAYSDRIAGCRRDNLEQSIRHYCQALEVRTSRLYPEDWATTQNGLATAYFDRIEGIRRENIEHAICHYLQALEIYTREAYPERWAATRNNLGNAYSDRIAGSRSENLEQAIQHYQQALEVRTREAFPADWAGTQNNLGLAYRNRIAGSQAENLEQAIDHYQQALEVYTRQAFPADWAMTQNNLANAYADRIAGSRSENLEQAIHHYQQALKVYAREAFPADWAMIQNNLANAYSDRIAGSRSENLEQAIQHYQQALEVRTRQAFPADWAATQNNLANAYSDRIAGSRAENLEQAIHHYRQALEVYTREAFPADWAMTQNNLANAYSDRIAGSRSENLEQAIQHYQQALEVYTQQADPINHRDTLRNLVLLHFTEKRWSNVYTAAEDAIAVGKDIFAVAVGDAGRMDAIKQTGALYTRAAYSAVQLGRYGEALPQLEAGKARLLAEAQSLGDAHLSLLTDDERGQVQALRDVIKALEYEYRLSTDNPARRTEQIIVAELGDARAALRGLIDALRAKYPNFMPEGLALDELLANIPADGALIAPLFTDQGSAVFIVPGGVSEVTVDHVLLLDDFQLADVHELTRGPADDSEWGGWLGAYFIFRRSGNLQALFNGIDDVTHRLWDAFVGRIHERLAVLGVQRVLFMPQGDTNLLPLHAAWREVDGVRLYFMDDYTVSYTPSMATLATARRKSTQGEGALVVGVSEYREMNDLPNTRAEAESIAALFSTEALLNSAVTVEAVKNGATGKAYVHLSCHGGFGWGGNTFASALYLGDEAPLPLPEIMANMKLDAARLVVLSACETGIVDVNNVPDEFVGLPAGFMQAGASAVVSSLWTVEDRSTALLIERMYKNMRGNDAMGPAAALREAQFWLRDATAQEIGDYYQSYLTRMSQSEAGEAFVEMMRRAAPGEKPYSHPFYWAAFTYSGI